MTKRNILGINIDNLSEDEVVEAIREKIVRKKKFWVATPNPEMVVCAHQDPLFGRILNSAAISIPDGAGLVLAGKILGKNIKERVTGVDLMARLCQLAASSGWRVALLGGKPGIGQLALTALRKRYPDLEGIAVEGVQDLRVKGNELIAGDHLKDETSKTEINQFKPQILFVGLGMGKQERWTVQNLANLNVNCVLVVGGAFDYYSGKVKRAPLWIRTIGFEWLWRLILEPWRGRRQLALPAFVWLTFQAAFFSWIPKK